MTNKFWIESISFSGERVAPTRVDFKPGFNIVHGPSDTGKTYLAKTIKYMLAGSTKPFSTETGYSVISMTLRTDEGTVKLTRTIGSSKITVSADPVFGIPHDEYAASPSEATKNEMTVSDVLLRLLGVTERRVVLTNQYGSRRPLAWKEFSDTLHRSEGRITSEESIFSTAKFATLSAFLTLFYDQDLSQLPEHADPVDLATRKSILVPVFDEQMNQCLTRLGLLQDRLNEIGDRDVSAELTTLTGQLAQLDSIQDTARAELSALTRQIAVAEQELSVRTMSARRYDDLSTVYVGNIKRLTFVADAQETLEATETPTNCPFCDNPLAEHDEVDYKHAAQAEAETIASDLEELAQVRAALYDQITVLKQRLEELRDQQRAVETRLSQAVLPKITQLRSQVATLEDHQATLTEYRMVEAEYDRLREYIDEILNPAEPVADYDPAERFPADFYTEMTRYLREILAETHFTDAEHAVFDGTDFDVRIGRKVKRTHGKGYRAFFNTILVLALRKYIHEHAIHKPSVVVLDTPTLGFEHQKSGDGLVTSRDETGRPKTGLLRNLFDYMVDSGEHGQLIILNNTDVTPTTRFDREDATELVFGTNVDADRLGLLIDLREGDAVDNADEIEQPMPPDPREPSN